MTIKEINKRVKNIKDLLKKDDPDSEIEASGEFEELTDDLHKEKKFTKVIECYHKIFSKSKNSKLFYNFNLAYAYNELEFNDDAEEVYEHLLEWEPSNSAILNNLSNLKKTKGKIDEAYDLITKAYEKNPDDEVIANNYNSLNEIVLEKKVRDDRFKASLLNLNKENSFVIDKLLSFLQNVKKDKEYKNGELPIPNWKFKKLMVTDEYKAISLKDQWIEKDYISETGYRGDYNVKIYEVNPFLEKAISEIKLKSINEDWISGIAKLNVEKLEELNYYKNVKKLNKVNKQFREILRRDFDELTLNYLMNNHKSTIILAGSIIESLLIYYLKKKKVSSVDYEIRNRKVSKDIFEATLNDLLLYLEQNKMLQKHFVHLGNISRIFRNFVHPGKELRENDELDSSKSDLCYISVCELIPNVIH